MAKKKEVSHYWDSIFKKTACGARTKSPKFAQSDRDLTCKNCIRATGIGRKK